jgi:hypothetical protein
MENRKQKLYFTPREVAEGELFKVGDVRGIMDDEENTNWWINLRYITECQTVFQLEIWTFKKPMREKFFEELTELVNKHTNK